MEALHPWCRWRKEGALPVGTGETSWQRRQAGFTEQRKHAEKAAGVGAKLGSTRSPHIPLATTSHVTSVGAREAGKCSLRLGRPFPLTVLPCGREGISFLETVHLSSCHTLLPRR